MQPGSVDPQLLLKTTQPRVPKSLLTRSRLSSLNAALADKSITVVQAAAGFGKTSLLAQWRREALQTGTLAAWLTLDGRDTDGRMAQGLALAMRSACGKPQFGLACLQAAQRDNGALEGITELLAEVAAMATETLLILDEAQALSDAVTHSALLYLLHNAPANLRIVIATRRPIPLPMGEILARGQFAVIESEVLAFELGETMAFLKARFGARMDSDSCVRLHELTEGWPLGIQLAVATIENSVDLAQAINDFSAHSGDIQRYFVDCLVDGLPAELGQLLVRLSFLDAISPSLCEAVLLDKKLAALLPRLRDSTPIFSSPVDSEWTQIHPLAREFLQVRFERLAQDERQALHTRAAEWLAAHALYEEAARQALQANLLDMAYDLAERCLHKVIAQGQVIRVSDWVERLPMTEIQRRPGLRLAVAWAQAQSPQHAEAIALVRPMVDDIHLAPGERCESTEVCATASLFADDISAVQSYVSLLDAKRPAHTALQKAVSLNLHALCLLYTGKCERARFELAAFPKNSALIGAYSLAWRDWLIGCSHLWEGQVQLGTRVLESGLLRAEAASGRRSPASVTLASALAAGLWESGQMEAASAVLANRLDVLERQSPPDAIAMGYLTAARLAEGAGEEQRALQLLDYLAALGEARQLPRLHISALAEQMRLHAVRYRSAACDALEQRLNASMAAQEPQQWGPLQPLVDLQVGLARAYAACARYGWDAALQLLTALLPQAVQLHRVRETLQINLLRALALKYCKQDGEPLLREALGLSQTLGLKQLLAHTHSDLQECQRQLQGASVAGGQKVAATVVAVPVRSSAIPDYSVASGALLTPKEREVLQLLAANMSNKQIALAMDISGETIKWHMKNLFGKLNAGTRKHLVDRARMLGILREH